MSHRPLALAQRLGNRNFERLLRAHVEQRATTPHIARAPEKSQPALKAGGPKVAGAALGTNRKAETVKVTRQIGGRQGYDDRWQATAVARLAKVEPAAVLLSTDGKWYPVETTAGFDAGRVANDPHAAESAASNPLIVELYGLPPLSSIAAARNNEARAAAILGVPESDIRVNVSVSGRAPGKVNIVGTPERGSPGGGHAPIRRGSGFEEGAASAIWIDLPELDSGRAAETLFHETQHLKDRDLAQAWVNTYTKETGRFFVKEATTPLSDWLNAQVKAKRLSKSDVELILMEIAGANAYTEARANVRSFLADLQAGDAALAKNALVGYAHALKPKSEGGGGEYGSPAPRSEVQAALVKELSTAYREMSPTVKKQYGDAVAAARSENPKAWISDLDFSTRAAK